MVLFFWIFLIFNSLPFTTNEISLRHLHDYNKDVMPIEYDSNHAENNALNVSLQIYINNMIPVDRRDRHYFVDILIRQYWKDQRLTYKKLGIEHEQDDVILFNEKAYDRIWKPDIFFPNAKEAISHKTTLPNRVFMLSRNGEVFYSHRVSMHVYCKMYLQNFPFDAQKCELNLNSYGHSEKFMRLYWNTVNNGPVFPPEYMNTSEFTLTQVRHNKKRIKIFEGNYFDRLIVEFTFARNYEYYILQMYLPAILIVILSWVGFWIDYRSTPARVSLGITTLLTMVTLSNSVRTSVPQSNYLKSIDAYIIICLCFVFITVIEFAFILTIENQWKINRKKKDDKRKKNFFRGNVRRTRKENIVAKQENIEKNDAENDKGSNLWIPNEEQMHRLNNLHKREKKKKKLKKVLNSATSLEDRLIDKQKRNQETHIVDRFMKKLIPVVFFTFNILYFYFSLR